MPFIRYLGRRNEPFQFLEGRASSLHEILDNLDSRSETEKRSEIIQFSEQREQSSLLELPSDDGGS